MDCRSRYILISSFLHGVTQPVGLNFFTSLVSWPGVICRDDWKTVPVATISHLPKGWFRATPRWPPALSTWFLHCIRALHRVVQNRLTSPSLRSMFSTCHFDAHPTTWSARLATTDAARCARAKPLFDAPTPATSSVLLLEQVPGEQLSTKFVLVMRLTSRLSEPHSGLDAAQMEHPP